MWYVRWSIKHKRSVWHILNETADSTLCNENPSIMKVEHWEVQRQPKGMDQKVCKKCSQST